MVLTQILLLYYYNIFKIVYMYYYYYYMLYWNLLVLQKYKIINMKYLNINIKKLYQYLILDPLAFIANAVRLPRESIILSIFLEVNSIIILLTLPENCLKDSLCIGLDLVPVFSFTLIKWKKFLVRSGLCGGTAKIIATILPNALQATARFLLWWPSWKKYFVTALDFAQMHIAPCPIGYGHHEVDLLDSFHFFLCCTTHC